MLRNYHASGACKIRLDSVFLSAPVSIIFVRRGIVDLKRLLTIPFALLLILTISAPLMAQGKADVAAVSFSQSTYSVGERLTYNVSFSNFPAAAHIELLVAERGTYFNREGVQLRAHVETTGVVNAALLSINNDYTTFVDPGSGQPFRSQQVVREGGRVEDTSSEYNQPLGASAIPAKMRTGEFPGTYDFLSAVYRLRSLPLAKDSTYYFTVRSDRAQYEAELKVTGSEFVKTNVGSFNTIVTRLKFKDSEINKYQLRIYFSDDERHVPVLITARHPAGEIRAELASSTLPSGAAPTNTGTPPPNITQIPGTPQQPAKVVPAAGGGIPGIPATRPNANPAGASGAGAASTTFPPGLPFSAGEQLNFNVFLGTNTQVLGTVSYQIRPRAQYFGHDGILFTVKARTTNAAQKIFYADDQINSYVDPSTLLPFRTELALREGTRRLNQTLTLDQDRGSATTEKGARIEIPVGTHDVISVLYALRSFNLAPPKRNAVSLLVENRPRTFFITALKREVISLGTQKISAVQLSLTTDDQQGDKYSLRLWVSEDRRRLPLRITATTPLGPLRADLAIIPVTQQ
ncbi:MAG TPA: DUF3108 domain-containing protein [Pyrinomonadaceae bacterium]|jgi:hypothetical protein